MRRLQVMLVVVCFGCAESTPAPNGATGDLIEAAFAAADGVSFDVPEDEGVAEKPGDTGKGPVADGYLASRAATTRVNSVLRPFIRRTLDLVDSTEGQSLEDGRRYWRSEAPDGVLEVIAEEYADGHVGYGVWVDTGSGRAVYGAGTFTPGKARERGAFVVFASGDADPATAGTLAVTYLRTGDHSELEAHAYGLVTGNGVPHDGRFRLVRDGTSGAFAFESTFELAAKVGDEVRTATSGRVVSRWSDTGGRSDITVPASGLGVGSGTGAAYGDLEVAECWDRRLHRTTYVSRQVSAPDGSAEPLHEVGNLADCAFTEPVTLALPPPRDPPTPPALEDAPPS